MVAEPGKHGPEKTSAELSKVEEDLSVRLELLLLLKLLLILRLVLFVISKVVLLLPGLLAIEVLIWLLGLFLLLRGLALVPGSEVAHLHLLTIELLIVHGLQGTGLGLHECGILS